MNAMNIFPSTPQPVGAVYEAANECPAGNSPPDIGGVAAPSIKRCEATVINAARYRACASRAAQTGWSGMTKCFRMRPLEEIPFSTTVNASPYRARASRPSAPLKEASRLLLDVASTLLCQEGSGAPNSFTPSLSPPTDITWTGSFERRGMSSL